MAAMVSVSSPIATAVWSAASRWAVPSRWRVAWIDDHAAWNALTVEQQELVIGRRKTDNIELPDDQKPVDAHIVVNTVEDAAGEQQQIVRLNMPFGELGKGEYGTFFIGYACTPTRIEKMLRNMFIGNPPGNHDRLLDFSRAVSGNLFFAPTPDFLEDAAE